MIREAIARLVERKDLKEEEMREVVAEIMDGQATQAQIASFLTALRVKGETPQEVRAAAEAMRDRAIKVEVPQGEPLVDVVGTGGDGMGTFNISTAAAFVVSGAGLRVAKHGNRSASSQCGSADVLEALGAKVELSKNDAERLISKGCFCFLFAPLFHPSLRHAAPVRKEIGIRTIFNILGPILNPASASHMLIGVPMADLCHLYGEALRMLGVKRAMIVFGLDGMDEASITGGTFVKELKDGVLKEYMLYPEALGLRRFPVGELKGGSAMENALILRSVLSGEERGAKREIVLLNAGCALYVAGAAKDIRQGIEVAREVLDSGSALKRLEEFIQESRACS